MNEKKRIIPISLLPPIGCFLGYLIIVIGFIGGPSDQAKTSWELMNRATIVACIGGLLLLFGSHVSWLERIIAIVLNVSMLQLAIFGIPKPGTPTQRDVWMASQMFFNTLGSFPHLSMHSFAADGYADEENVKKIFGSMLDDIPIERMRLMERVLGKVSFPDKDTALLKVDVEVADTSWPWGTKPRKGAILLPLKRVDGEWKVDI